MLNSIQLFAFVVLGGLCAGEIARRILSLPRTTGFVLFGLLTGQSGLNWITPAHIDSAHLFIDLALGLILFELGYLFPKLAWPRTRSRLLTGCAISTTVILVLCALFLLWGSPLLPALFIATLCLATSPAITIATCSDVGAKGEKTGLLYSLVAVHGGMAFAVATLLLPFLQDHPSVPWYLQIAQSLAGILGSVVLGGACAAGVLFGARFFKNQAEHQHLLILGSILLGAGTALQWEIPVFLPMLIFGWLVQHQDKSRQVIGVHIARDARVFLVITFVLAGAALNLQDLWRYWPEALLVTLLRFLGQWGVVFMARRSLELTPSEGLSLCIGLQPMSSIALVLLANTQVLYSGIPPKLSGTLMATLLLLQLLGPLATQTAIQRWGEATRLRPGTAKIPE